MVRRGELGEYDDVHWQNWAGNQVAAPVAIHHPSTEDELVAIVKQAAAEGRRVKVVGAGHSFTDIATTDGHLVVLDQFAHVLGLDAERHEITVEAGLTLHELNDVLDARGLAMPNLGDIDVQTVAGATSTSTHGTGVKLPGLAANIVGLRLITADGTIVEANADEQPEVLSVARVGLGALGIVSSMTWRVVPAFNLHVVNETMKLDRVLAELDTLVDGNDHFEFFWVPHTGSVLTKSNNRTTDALAPRSRLKAYGRDVVLENVGFGLLCRAGRRRPSLIPRLARVVSANGRAEFVDRSYEVFATRRLVRFYEMEYAIPRPACAEALTRVRKFVEGTGLRISFPIEVRFAAADDIALSTAGGRESAYIAVHVFEGTEYAQYFQGVERIMDAYDGRPHWGKLHFKTAETLAPLYPRWDEFHAVRRRLDPEGRFANSYTERVLDPIG